MTHSDDIARTCRTATYEETAHVATDVGRVAEAGRTDAVSAGIVHTSDRGDGTRARSSGASVARSSTSYRPSGSHVEDADAEATIADDDGATVVGKEGTTRQGSLYMRAAIADAAIDELDDSDELQGVGGMYRGTRGVARFGRKASAGSRAAARASSDAVPATSRGAVNARAVRKDAAAKARAKEATVKAGRVNARIQSRRTWLAARAASEKAAGAAAGRVARGGAARAIVAAVSAAAGPLSGVIAGVIAFVLVVLMVSQLVSALFGFWTNESYKASMAGLPSYITQEMVLTALECQETYGHPAGCTIAQIICESGQGDHLSGLATQDNNLFGIKWAARYGLEPEVSGCSSWETGEEYDGEQVRIIAQFTSFNSYKDCIVFRSRVFLQASRYSQNALIMEAISTHSSDKMAEGLKDAGYATSSSYVESLKTAMTTYNLYRFDSMTVDQFKQIGLSGDAIVAAAQSQLGVPYVWGGTTPGVGLDCSGLTQYCYACAGISIPRNSEDQMSAGKKVLLSEAQAGDILWRSGHVAIYIGGDQYIHAPQTGDVVKVSTGISWFTCAISYRG